MLNPFLQAIGNLFKGKKPSTYGQAQGAGDPNLPIPPQFIGLDPNMGSDTTVPQMDENGNPVNPIAQGLAMGKAAGSATRPGLPGYTKDPALDAMMQKWQDLSGQLTPPPAPRQTNIAQAIAATIAGAGSRMPGVQSKVFGIPEELRQIGSQQDMANWGANQQAIQAQMGNAQKMIGTLQNREEVANQIDTKIQLADMQAKNKQIVADAKNDTALMATLGRGFNTGLTPQFVSEVLSKTHPELDQAGVADLTDKFMTQMQSDPSLMANIRHAREVEKEKDDSAKIQAQQVHELDTRLDKSTTSADIYDAMSKKFVIDHGMPPTPDDITKMLANANTIATMRKQAVDDKHNKMVADVQKSKDQAAAIRIRDHMPINDQETAAIQSIQQAKNEFEKLKGTIQAKNQAAKTKGQVAAGLTPATEARFLKAQADATGMVNEYDGLINRYTETRDAIKNGTYHMKDAAGNDLDDGAAIQTLTNQINGANAMKSRYTSQKAELGKALDTLHAKFPAKTDNNPKAPFNFRGNIGGHDITIEKVG